MHTLPLTNVVMVSPGVEMRCHKHLIFVAPHLPGKLASETVTLLRRDLTGLEALVGMVSNISATLTETLLHRYHFLRSGVRFAVDTRHGVEAFALVHDLVLVGGIFQDLIQLFEIDLVGVCRIFECLCDIAFDLPDFCDCYFSHLPSW